MRAVVFNIKRFAIHDGPGIRTTFFLKGCPLRCIWCHNPEGIDPNAMTLERTKRIGNTEFKRHDALGKEYSVEQILIEAKKDKLFMDNSGGGVTFSGGEPLMQVSFLKEILPALKGCGYHTAIDTSGAVPFQSFIDIMDYTNLFLYDLKHTDSSVHRMRTGEGNEEIVKNLHLLLKQGARVELRIPVIPGINSSEREILNFAGLINELPGQAVGVTLLPFHTAGISKYRLLGLHGELAGTVPDSPDILRRHADILIKETGLRVSIGG